MHNHAMCKIFPPPGEMHLQTTSISGNVARTLVKNDIYRVLIIKLKMILFLKFSSKSLLFPALETLLL